MMRPSKIAIAVGGTAVIISVGYAAAPKSVPTVTLVQPHASAGPAGPAGSGVFDGPTETNPRGELEAEITVSGGKVTKVDAIKAGRGDLRSAYINSIAIPMLVKQVLASQAWTVQWIGGASYTSSGFTESLKGTFAKAGLNT